MKIIFLDIDGVLNTERYLRVQVQKFGYKDLATMQYNFDPVALNNLKEIIETINANIVISSTWRLNRDNNESSKEWSELIRNLDSVGIGDKVIGITPIVTDSKNMPVRWLEIKRWLQENTDINIEEFIIIDDEWEMGEYTETNFARCWSYSGLTSEVKEKVLSMFL